MSRRRAAVLAAAVALGAATAAAPRPAGAGEPPAVEAYGTLPGRTTWRGTVMVTGDVEIPADGGLVVEAGTRVVVAAGDRTGAGWNARRVEIHVRGDLLIAGTLESPVLFEPAAGAPRVPAEAEDTSGIAGARRAGDLARYPWHGVVLHAVEGRAVRREIRGARFSSAFAAIQVPAGGVRVEDAAFLDCGVGVEAGSAYADHERFGVKGGVARPSIVRSRFAGCGTGIFAQSQGAPRAERSVFVACGLGIGGGRTTGRTYPVGEPGVTASRCDFHDNRIGVAAPFLVTDSVFVGNRRALALSEFHASHATGVDLFRIHGSVSFADREILRVESAEDGIRILDAPPHAAAAADLHAAIRAPWPPLPDALALDPGSPARGVAADGGDPGSLGAAGAHALAGAAGRGAPLPPPLAVALAPGGGDGADIRGRVPAPGAVVRASWWSAVAPPPEDGAVPLRPLGGAGGGAAGLAWRFRSDRAGDGVLELDGDLDGLAAWWNGDALPPPRVPRRRGPGGIVAIPVRVKSGANALVVAARGRGPEPAIAAALVPPPGAAILPAETTGDARDTTVTAAALVRARGREGGPFLRLALSGPVAWTRPGTVRLLDAAGRPLDVGRAAVEIAERQVVLLGPLPDALPAGLLAAVEGFAAPDGTPCAFPPAPVPVQP